MQRVIIWSRNIILLTIVFAYLVFMSPAFAETNDYGALYTGEFSDADAKRFIDRFDALPGWYQEVWKTSWSSTNYPRHYHFTKGLDNNYTESGSDSDILYVSGHAYPDSTWPLYRKVSGYTKPQKSDDDITPDTTTISNSDWEIGIEWNGLWPNNESRWNYDTEWIILAGCSQLNTIDETKAVWPSTNPTNSLAKTWARTLLGNGARAHAIMGYHDRAPGDIYDVEVVDRFIDNLTIDRDTVITSWAEANTKPIIGTANWALVVHTANINDHLPGYGTETADTTGTYYINYYSSNSNYYGKRILDGRGGSYENMSMLPFYQRFVNSMNSLLGIEDAYANQASKDVQVGKTKFTLGVNALTQLNAETISRNELNIKRNPKKEQEIVESFADASSDITKETRSNGTEVYYDKNKKGAKLEKYTSGAILWDSGEQIGNDTLKLSKDEAGQQAKDFIKKHGGLPEDAELTRVTTVNKALLNLDSDEKEKFDVLSYSFFYSKKTNEITTDGAEGIEVTVGPNGTSMMYRLWNDSIIEEGPVKQVITPDQALESFKELAPEYWNIGDPGNAEISDINLVYYSKDFDKEKSKLMPAWRFLIDGKNPVYVDAYTGGKVQ